jgi:hypothetical protein
VTHPFHPWHGREFVFVGVRQTWDEDRVFLLDEDGTQQSLPSAWTDAAAPYPFVVVAAGRSAFRSWTCSPSPRCSTACAGRSMATSCKPNYAGSVRRIVPVTDSPRDMPVPACVHVRARAPARSRARRGARARLAGGRRAGDERLVVDVDSFVGEVHGYQKQGAAFGYTRERGYHPLLASRADTGEVLHFRRRAALGVVATRVQKAQTSPLRRGARPTRPSDPPNRTARHRPRATARRRPPTVDPG